MPWEWIEHVGERHILPDGQIAYDRIDQPMRGPLTIRYSRTLETIPGPDWCISCVFDWGRPPDGDHNVEDCGCACHTAMQGLLDFCAAYQARQADHRAAWRARVKAGIRRARDPRAGRLVYAFDKHGQARFSRKKVTR